MLEHMGIYSPRANGNAHAGRGVGGGITRGAAPPIPPPSSRTGRAAASDGSVGAARRSLQEQLEASKCVAVVHGLVADSQTNPMLAWHYSLPLRQASLAQCASCEGHSRCRCWGKRYPRQ